MAETFLKFLLDNLSSLIQKEIGLMIGVDMEMKKLSSTLTAIQGLVEDAEMKQWENNAIHAWLRKLNDPAYEINALLEECATQVSKWKPTKSSRYGLKKILFPHKIGRRMKEATEKLEMIAAERQKLHLREMVLQQKCDFFSIREMSSIGFRETSSVRVTSSILNEPERVYGRDEVKEKIVDILVNQVRHSEQLSVLPITGLGGFGKTTLAQLVFNDTQVVDHFETKIWVCKSHDFDLKRLIKAMIESVTGQGSCSDLVFLDALQQRLRELLNQKRYLIVFDDVWNEDQEKWDMLRNSIACGSRGAAVVFTTCLKKVAQLMGTLAPHELTRLSDEDCWLLFKERAFRQGKEEHPNLEPIGKKIVKKCRGVPLEVKAVGGRLRFTRERKDWIKVQNSEFWDLPISPASRFLKKLRHLVLEYYYSMSETRSKLGELSSLKTLSLFVVGKGKGNQPGELQFLNHGGKLEIRHLERVKDHMDAKMAYLHAKEDLDELRLAWNYHKRSEIRENADEKVLEALEPHPNLEILQIDGFQGRCFPEWLRNPTLVNLVIFELSSCRNCPSFPQLGELPHLKIMRLSHLDVEYIVEAEVGDGSPSMIKFPSLLQLDLNSLVSLKGLAKEEGFEIFPCLQMLDIQKCSSLILPPLPSVKVLKVDDHVSSFMFISNPENLTSLRFPDGNFPVEALENLSNLKNLTIDKAHENSISAQGLRGLKSLENLSLNKSKTLTCFPHGWCAHLTALKRLTIDACSEFDDFPEDVSYMQSLRTLNLSELPKMISVPESLKHLPSLYFLYLAQLPELTALPACLKSFTSLENLVITDCPRLTSLPHSIKEMGKLRSLSITKCPELERRCGKIRGEEWHKIKQIRSLRIGNKWWDSFIY